LGEDGSTSFYFSLVHEELLFLFFVDRSIAQDFSTSLDRDEEGALPFFSFSSSMPRRTPLPSLCYAPICCERYALVSPPLPSPHRGTSQGDEMLSSFFPPMRAPILVEASKSGLLAFSLPFPETEARGDMFFSLCFPARSEKKNRENERCFVLLFLPFDRGERNDRDSSTFLKEMKEVELFFFPGRWRARSFSTCGIGRFLSPSR